MGSDRQECLRSFSQVLRRVVLVCIRSLVFVLRSDWNCKYPEALLQEMERRYNDKAGKGLGRRTLRSNML